MWWLRSRRSAGWGGVWDRKAGTPIWVSEHLDGGWAMCNQRFSLKSGPAAVGGVSTLELGGDVPLQGVRSTS